MSENEMSIDPIEYGKLSQQVKHLAEAQEGYNRALAEQRESTDELTAAVRELSSRLVPIEGSVFMQPAKLGKAAMVFAAIIVLLAIKGIAGTMEIIAKAVLP